MSGYEETRTEKLRSEWANTDLGKLAYEFTKTVSLEKVAKCNEPGWYVVKNACYVKPAPDKNIYGWNIPLQ